MFNSSFGSKMGHSWVRDRAYIFTGLVIIGNIGFVLGLLDREDRMTNWVGKVWVPSVIINIIGLWFIIKSFPYAMRVLL